MTRRLMPAMAALAAVLLWVAGLAIPSADAAGADGSCLLQRQPGAATPRQDKHDLRGESESLKGCLAFIHIPKAMGGSIELSRLHAWGVPFNRTDGCQWQLRKHGTESVRKQRQEPGALWGSCDAGIPCTHVDLNEKYGNTCSQPSLFSGKRCSAWHFSPSFDSRLASYYTETCDSFCVVRHPLERFISQYRHIRQVGKYEGYKSYGKHPCDAKHLERFANETLKELNLEQDCHLVPQVYYIFQEGNPEDRRLCRHVLNMTDAAEQFPKLMQRYGLEHVTLGGHDHLYHDRCEKIVPTAKTIELVKQFYRQDYAAFGFV